MSYYTIAEEGVLPAMRPVDYLVGYQKFSGFSSPYSYRMS